MGLKDNQPIYLQLADSLMDDILAGRYKVDERVPSVRDCAANAQVNANTAVRAYEYLENSGVIYNRRGLGYFVAADAANLILEARRKEFFSTEMAYFFGRLRSLGMTPEQLADHYSSFLNN